MTLHRVLRTAKASLTRTFHLDETPTDATGAVHVTITRLDGTAVEDGDAAGPAANVYTYTFGGRDVLDELVVSWTATVSGDAIVLDQDRIQVVGGFFFSLAEGRAVDNALTSTTTYPTAKLIAARIEVEDEAERICSQQSFVPRFKRVTLNGNGQSSLYAGVPHLRALRAVSVGRPGETPTAWTAPQLSQVALHPTGVMTLWGGVWPVGHRNIIVELEHGLDAPPPEVIRVAKIRFKSLLTQPKSAMSDRAVQVPGGGAQTQQMIPLSSPTSEKTGIPDVDAVYARVPLPTPGFG